MISFVIPYWPIDDETEAALKKCVASLPHDSEKIIIYNEGTGFSKNVNRGIKLANGDFVAVINSDVTIESGDINLLCIDDAVCSPFMIPTGGVPLSRVHDAFHGSFWVTSKKVLDKVGLMDERFEGGFWEDNDILRRFQLSDIDIWLIDDVIVGHYQALTMDKAPLSPVWMMENEQRFKDKWS